MKEFKGVLKEVNVIVDEVLVFDLILTTVLIFLGGYLILMLLTLNPWYSLFPTLFYLLFLLYKNLNKNKYKIVEDEYVPLYEKLRTAADNVEKENPVVDELQLEVVNDLRNVRVSSFVKIKKISFKVLGCILLCLAILFASIYNVNFGRLNLPLDKLKDLVYKEGTAGGGNGTNSELIAGKDGKGDQNLFGEESIAKIGSQEVQIKIKQSSLEVVGTASSEVPEKEFEETFPDEVFATASGSYEDKITIENQKLVKDYFKELSKG